MIRGRHFNEETGEIDLERLEAYRRLESELTGLRGRPVVMMVAPPERPEEGLCRMFVTSLSEDKVIDGTEERLATPDGYVTSEVVRVGAGEHRQPQLTFRAHSPEGSLKLADRGYDFGHWSAGEDDDDRLTVMPADGFPVWLEEKIEDEAVRYALYVEFRGNLIQLGQEAEVAPVEGYEPFLAAERAALTDYRAFFDEVRRTNRGFVENGLTRGNLQPLIDARKNFERRWAELKEAHGEIAWRLPMILVADQREWPHLDFDAYEPMFRWDVTEQLKALKREASEMDRRLEAISGQEEIVASMEITPAA